MRELSCVDVVMTFGNENVFFHPWSVGTCLIVYTG